MHAEDSGAGNGRALGVDPGTRRTGLAVSDLLGATAQGMETFSAGGMNRLVEHIGRLIEEMDIETVVIGLPLSMSGGETEGAGRSRALARRLEKEYGVETVLVDERMTSLEAERLMRQEGRIRDPGDIDRLAAVLLLQGWLDGRRRR